MTRCWYSLAGAYECMPRHSHVAPCLAACVCVDCVQPQRPGKARKGPVRAVRQCVGVTHSAVGHRVCLHTFLPHARSYFGELALFAKKPRNATVRAAAYCDLNVLQRHDLERLLALFPAVAEKMQKVRAARGGREAKAARVYPGVLRGRGGGCQLDPCPCVLGPYVVGRWCKTA